MAQCCQLKPPRPWIGSPSSPRPGEAGWGPSETLPGSAWAPGPGRLYQECGVGPGILRGSRLFPTPHRVGKGQQAAFRTSRRTLSIQPC